MIRLLNIQIEGFCSVVEPQTVPLNVGGTVLVKAPNGFGKTTLFSAIAWVLYGKNLKGNPNVNTWKRYQPKNYKGTKVTLTFDSDKGVYQVTRCLKYTGKLDDGAKGGDRIILVREGETLNIKGKVKLLGTGLIHVKGIVLLQVRFLRVCHFRLRAFYLS